ncbi:MAG TPA: hypothetical protein PK294_13040 [Ignavibacteria bacterium]|nr:hypothetical protein [Ignavibacteria bacterium]HQY51233.1 hypothetical protein [Ignavibacteria bacterium]HRB01353.1 hypothetical protein [Ignavibacteria bacterium]
MTTLNLKHILPYIFILSTVIFFSNESLYSQKKTESVKTDEFILITDNQGNILDGDKKDWTYNDKSYNKINAIENLFVNPVNDTNLKNQPDWKIVDEIIGNKLLLKWNTPKGFTCKGFAVERIEIKPDSSESDWVEIDYVRGVKTAPTTSKYSYIDKKLKEGKYKFRIKMDMNDGTSKYLNLNKEVFWMEFPTTLQFYPVYPNPVKEKFNVRFFLPSNDEISIFFINGTDTVYVMKKIKLGQGFYEKSIDKNTFKYYNEVKRIYLTRKSMRRKEYTGDIKFE